MIINCRWWSTLSKIYDLHIFIRLHPKYYFIIISLVVYTLFPDNNYFIYLSNCLYLLHIILGHYDRQKLSLPGSTTSQRRATIMSRSSEHINSLRSSAAYEMTAVSDYLNGHGTPLHMRSTPEIVTKIDVEVRLYLFAYFLFSLFSIYLTINISINSYVS